MEMSSDTITDGLTAFIRRRFQVSENDRRFGPNVHLSNDGYVDSLGIAELVSFIEERFQVRLPDDAFFDEGHMTINGMVALITRLSAANSGGETSSRKPPPVPAVGLEIRSFLWNAMGRRKEDPETDSFRTGLPIDVAQLDGWVAAGANTGVSNVNGHFAVHVVRPDGKHLLARDVLGVNKLFYAITDAGPVSSSFWHDLIRAGHAPSSIWSVPAGHVAVLEPGSSTPTLVRHTALPFGEGAANAVTEEMAAPIRRRLEAVFRGLKEELAGRRLYVSLSGGLDSTAIASLAREFLGDITAVTFTVGGNRSEDLISAEKVAKDLGLRLLVIEVSAKDILGALDEALLWGQDWREFNVHCALVNVSVGRAIQKDNEAAGGKLRPVVLTGDVMNELMTDYSAVTYRGQEHYALPNVPIGLLRRVLVGGLDAGDREVGVFWKCGVETVQPYALAASAYTALPASLLGRPGAKQTLVRAILGDRVPAHVYSRPKVRAQEGTAGGSGGTLSVCVDNGIDTTWMKNRFAELYRLEPSELHHYIRGGYYRAKPATMPPPAA